MPFLVLGDGHELHYSDTGRHLPHGTTVVVVHDLAAHGTHEFADLGVLLSRGHQRRVIVPDLPGFGYSAQRPASHCTFDRSAEDLAALVAHLSLDKSGYVIYGSGHGWCVVLTYLARVGANAPGLRGLICEDGVPKALPGNGWKGIRKSSEDFFSLIAHAAEDPVKFITGFAEPGLGPFADDPDRLDFFKTGARLVQPANLVRYLADWSTFDQTAVLPQIKAAGIPIVVAHGKFSGLTKSDLEKQAAATGGDFQEFVESGHRISLCERQRFFEHIDAFVDKVQGGDAKPVGGATAAAAAEEPASSGGKSKKKKKSKKKDKAEAAPAKQEEPAPASGLDPKAAKAARKEGGKKGQDLAGMADIGGVRFFHVVLESCDGDFGLLEEAMQGANAEVGADSEERKGGAGQLGKMLLSASVKQLAIYVHVPDEVSDKLSLDDWVAAVNETVKGQVFDKSENYAKIVAPLDESKERFPLKMRDAASNAGFALLRSKQLIPDEDSDSDVDYSALQEEAGIEW